MKDKTLQDREWFLEELEKLSEKSGKRVNIMGRESWEERIGEKMPPEPTSKDKPMKKKADNL